MLENRLTINGHKVEIDTIMSNGRVIAGTVFEEGNGTRCLWDAKTGQCWGPEKWDLRKEEDAPTS